MSNHNSNYITVLNDGETYTDVNGVAIMGMPDDADMEQIEEMLDAEEGNLLVTFWKAHGGVIIEIHNGAPVHVIDRRGL